MIRLRSHLSHDSRSVSADSIICDAHITQAYVISLFLEWAALFTLLLVILALVVSVATRSSKVIMREEEEDLHEEEEGEVELEVALRLMVPRRVLSRAAAISCLWDSRVNVSSPFP